jgi:hypothetical protein
MLWKFHNPKGKSKVKKQNSKMFGSYAFFAQFAGDVYFPAKFVAYESRIY